MVKVMIVADPGTNWAGDMDILKKIVKGCKDAGCDAVKPQLWDSIIFPHEAAKRPYYSIQRKCELTFDEAKEVFEYGKQIGIEIFFSVFDTERVGWCEKIGVQRYKVASRSACDMELLKCIADTGKPVIISMGMKHLQYWKYYHINDPQLPLRPSFLYCVSQYPPSYSDICIPDFNKYAASTVYHGFSDHTTDDLSSLVAVSRGARIIERHVCLNKKIDSPDLCCSLTINQLKSLVNKIRIIERMIK